MLGPFEPSAFLPEDLDQGTLPLGDGGPVVSDLARALVSQGISVTLLGLSAHVDKTWRASDGELSMVLVPMRRGTRRRLLDSYRIERELLISAARALASDVVHAQWPYVYAHAALAVNPHAIVGVHDSPVRLFRHAPSVGLLKLIQMARYTSKRAGNVVAVSPHVANTWVTDLGGVEPIDIVPNVLPFEESTPLQPADRGRVISVGHKHKNKNLHTLIRAWPAIHDAIPGARLHLAGVGPEYLDSDPTFKMATKMGVRALGVMPRTQILRILNGAELMIHPSKEEAFSMALLEAMACGVPGIAGEASGSPPWLLRDAGLLVDVRDPAEIAGAAIRCMASPHLHSKLRMNALRRAEDFRPSRVIPGLLRVYSDISR